MMSYCQITSKVNCYLAGYFLTLGMLIVSIAGHLFYSWPAVVAVFSLALSWIMAGMLSRAVRQQRGVAQGALCFLAMIGATLYFAIMPVVGITIMGDPLASPSRLFSVWEFVVSR
jgi:hypothetical protein